MFSIPRPQAHIEYGRKITPSENARIYNQVKEATASVQRNILGAGDVDSKLNLGKGDLGTVLTVSFGKDLDLAIHDIVCHSTSRHSPERKFEFERFNLIQNLSPIIRYGIITDSKFIDTLNTAIEAHSKITWVASNSENESDIESKDRGLQRIKTLDGLFSCHPQDVNQADTRLAFVETPEFGRVTILQWYPAVHLENLQHTIGVNGHQDGAPGFGTTLGPIGEIKGLRIHYGSENLAHLKNPKTPPTAESLVLSVFRAMELKARISFEPPAELTLKHFA